MCAFEPGCWCRQRKCRCQMCMTACALAGWRWVLEGAAAARCLWSCALWSLGASAAARCCYQRLMSACALEAGCWCSCRVPLQGAARIFFGCLQLSWHHNCSSPQKYILIVGFLRTMFLFLCRQLCFSVLETSAALRRSLYFLCIFVHLCLQIHCDCV